MQRLLREPLLHFAVLGALLFGIYGWVNRGRGGVEPSRQIELTLDDVVQLELYFQSQWRRPPTAQELASLAEDRIREEVLYREALAMGLDKDDTIVKRRMAQKMDFLAEDVASAREPTDDELRAWFAKNSEKFAVPGRVSFRHLYFSPDKRGARARGDAEQALAKLIGQPQNASGAAAHADPFMFQDYYGERSDEQLAKEFGPQFAQAVEKLAPGSWQGPIESGYGWHLVFVDASVPGRLPAFEEVEPDVRTGWLAAAKERAREEAYQAMRAKYTVLVPAPPAELPAQPASTSADAVPPL